MPVILPSHRTCADCGEELTPETLGGLCIQCLFRLASDAGEQTEGARVVPVTEKPGDCIGRYKLIQKLGEGGFGAVYLAEQEEPVRRRVALKVIKLGMDTREVIARFEAERQALAVMDHPNIAKVLDAGATDTGRPYFVMELVRGIRITEYCDQHQLPTRERLDLFIQVCQAIQHAHQKGIIHRDIKPSNILVAVNDGPAAAGVPKVIDFGIAKATEGRLTDKTLFTAFQQFLGTPAYMSPEQAEMTSLDIDTRTDIYSLGVLLYELLTGKTPFDTKELLAAGLDALRCAIREREPMRPSTRLSTLVATDLTEVARCRRTDPPKLMHVLRGDLDWIVMKALEKDRTRRYDTANGLAMDVRRHLANEPVDAVAPSAAYRFRKFARRNKTALAVAASIAGSLIAATAVSAWQAIRANQQAVRAMRAEELAKERILEVGKERDAKETARQEAVALTTFLTGVLRSPDPRRDGRTITIAETLDTARKKLDADHFTQPRIQARMQFTLGVTYHALGLDRDAIPLLEKARDYYLVDVGPEHPVTLDAMQVLASSYLDAGHREEALKLREEVLALRRKLDGPEHPDTLKAMHNLAISYSAAGRREQALGLREDVLTLSRKVLDAGHADIVVAMHALALSYSDAGRREEALQLQEEVLALWRKLNSPEHPDTLSAMHNLAISYFQTGRRDESLKLLEEVLTLSRKVKGPEHPDTLGTMNDLALSYTEAGRREEARKVQEEVLVLRRKVSGPEHRDTLKAMRNLATSYANARCHEEALKLREEALTLSRKANGPEHPDTLGAMHDLALSCFDAGHREDALKLREEALALRRKVNGPEHPDTLIAMNSLGTSYSHAGCHEEALKLREEVLTLSRKVNGPQHPVTLGAMNNLALSYSDAGRRDEALKLREEVLALRRMVLGSEHTDTLRAMHNLVNSYSNAGRHNEAIRLGEEVLTLSRKVNGPEHPDTLNAMANLASSYGKVGRLGEANKLQEEWRTKAKADQQPSNGNTTVPPTKP